MVHRATLLTSDTRRKGGTTGSALTSRERSSGTKEKAPASEEDRRVEGRLLRCCLLVRPAT